MKQLARLKNLTTGLSIGMLGILLTQDLSHAETYGNSSEVVSTSAGKVKVYQYRPKTCPQSKLLVVFAGYYRNARDYRRYARPLAQKHCFVVLSPRFKKNAFPRWRYNKGGVVRHGKMQPKELWTGTVISELIAWARETEQRPFASVILFGHSAGAQLLSRVAAYTPIEGVDRLVIANPSVHVAPSLSENVPYGFRKIFDRSLREDQLRRYLAQPVSIYVGSRDTGKRLLVRNKKARRQGRNRLERGRNVFAQGKQVARKKGWAFNWRFVIAQDVGHSPSDMLSASEIINALGVNRTHENENEKL